MAYSSARMMSVKLDSSPSMLCNNLSASAGRLVSPALRRATHASAVAIVSTFTGRVPPLPPPSPRSPQVYAHKDTLCVLSYANLETKTQVEVQRLPIPAPHVNQVAALCVSGETFLCAAARSSVCVYHAHDSTERSSVADFVAAAPPSAPVPGGPPPSKGGPPPPGVLLRAFTLGDAGIPTGREEVEFFRGLAACPSTDTLLVGTSWGEVLQLAVARGAPSAGSAGAASSSSVLTLAGRLQGGHKAAVTCIAADERYIVSADDLGSVSQWDAGTGRLLVRHDRGAGYPATALALHGDVIVAGYGSGHVRIFRCGNAPGGARFMEVELTAHARSVTAVSFHPSAPTFASVGEDGLVNVWSLPELGTAGGGVGAPGSGTGKARVLLDMTARVANAVLTGAAFVCPGGVSRSGKTGGPVHLVLTAYDSFALTVFLGLR